MPEARISATPRLATSRALPARPERAAGTAERADVGVVADVVVQEVEDVLGVVIQRRRLFLDEGVGGVGVRRRGQQVGIDAAGREHGRGRRVGNRAAVEHGISLRPLSSCKIEEFDSETVIVTLVQ